MIIKTGDAQTISVIELPKEAKKFSFDHINKIIKDAIEEKIKEIQDEVVPVNSEEKLES